MVIHNGIELPRGLLPLWDTWWWWNTIKYNTIMYSKKGDFTNSCSNLATITWFLTSVYRWGMLPICIQYGNHWLAVSLLVTPSCNNKSNKQGPTMRKEQQQQSTTTTSNNDEKQQQNNQPCDHNHHHQEQQEPTTGPTTTTTKGSPPPPTTTNKNHLWATQQQQKTTTFVSMAPAWSRMFC